MKFNNADIERLVGRTLIIECFEVELTENHDDLPISFNGPGSITVESDGKLLLKMYDSTKKSSMSQMMRIAFHQGTGVVPESEYFSLRAKDSNGNLWLAPRNYINNGLQLTPHGAIIEFYITELRSEREWLRTDLKGVSIANIVIAGRYRLPFNKFEDQADGSSSVTGLEFRIENAEITLSQKAKHLTLDVVSTSVQIDHDYIIRISEALSIAIGREAWPSYYQVYREGVLSSFVNGKSDVSGQGMVRPLVDVFPYKTAKLITFLNCYMKNRKKEHDHTVYYWRRLYYISNKVTDVAALILTVNIEGLINNYFRDGRTPSDTLLGEINLSKKRIDSLRLPGSTKSRLKNTLGGMKKITAPNILRALADEGEIIESHVKSWNNLRHSLAHAGNMESDAVTLSRFVDDINNCLDLFYHLIGLSVGYDGRLIKDGDLLSPAESKCAAEQQLELF
ncbi:hypothetical protein H8F23_26550 [Pseudomonas sp. P155]|uniref:ApeA N-terminal domain-containing protein n=1 Tax=Pseudomonas neuropathica TaxID=2730425 RepID=A0ABS0BQV2_9PSED|nr:hypothetical protein [Pseudomonas neuropathica]MBF6036826.1 hypothetical protein [Pseudomonas neuropathica]